MLIAQRPTLTEEVVEEDRRSRFVIEPLKPGFGYTLGNCRCVNSGNADCWRSCC